MSDIWELSTFGNAALEIHHLDQLAAIAAHNHVYSMTCLRQALTLRWLLARRGVAADLQIGVRREAGALEAHAWVECAGQAVGETSDMQNYFFPLTNLLTG